MVGKIDNIHPELVEKLKELERIYGKELTINSGHRDPAHNKEVGGVDHSEHTYTPAEGVDIDCNHGSVRWNLVTLALKLGFLRIGIGKTFVHLGIAQDKPQRVIWHYYK
jgi:uncharacterized protein YcbK (DUF882 family)